MNHGCPPTVRRPLTAHSTQRRLACPWRSTGSFREGAVKPSLKTAFPHTYHLAHVSVLVRKGLEKHHTFVRPHLTGRRYVKSHTTPESSHYLPICDSRCLEHLREETKQAGLVVLPVYREGNINILQNRWSVNQLS